MERTLKISLLFTLWLVFLQATTVTSTCTYSGRVFQVGHTWVDAVACDACECFKTGVQCYARLDDGHCKINSSIASPGDPVCLYAMKLYVVGESFMALDGCNKCACTARGMTCTINSCNVNGFAQPSKTPLYGECLYADQWYHFRSQWLTRDGCNTCFCYSIGNYRGGHVCTKNTCSTSLVNIAG